MKNDKIKNIMGMSIVIATMWTGVFSILCRIASESFATPKESIIIFTVVFLAAIFCLSIVSN